MTLVAGFFSQHMGASIVMGVPPIMDGLEGKSHLELDDNYIGVPIFQETTIFTSRNFRFDLFSGFIIPTDCSLFWMQWRKNHQPPMLLVGKSLMPKPTHVHLPIFCRDEKGCSCNSLRITPRFVLLFYVWSAALL